MSLSRRYSGPGASETRRLVIEVLSDTCIGRYVLGGLARGSIGEEGIIASVLDGIQRKAKTLQAKLERDSVRDNFIETVIGRKWRDEIRDALGKVGEARRSLESGAGGAGIYDIVSGLDDAYRTVASLKHVYLELSKLDDGYLESILFGVRSGRIYRLWEVRDLLVNPVLAPQLRNIQVEKTSEVYTISDPIPGINSTSIDRLVLSWSASGTPYLGVWYVNGIGVEVPLKTVRRGGISDALRGYRVELPPGARRYLNAGSIHIMVKTDGRTLLADVLIGSRTLSSSLVKAVPTSAIYNSMYDVQVEYSRNIGKNLYMFLYSLAGEAGLRPEAGLFFTSDGLAGVARRMGDNGVPGPIYIMPFPTVTMKVWEPVVIPLYRRYLGAESVKKLVRSNMKIKYTRAGGYGVLDVAGGNKLYIPAIHGKTDRGASKWYLFRHVLDNDAYRLAYANWNTGRKAELVAGMLMSNALVETSQNTIWSTGVLASNPNNTSRAIYVARLDSRWSGVDEVLGRIGVGGQTYVSNMDTGALKRLEGGGLYWIDLNIGGDSWIPSTVFSRTFRVTQATRIHDTENSLETLFLQGFMLRRPRDDEYSLVMRTIKEYFGDENDSGDSGVVILPKLLYKYRYLSMIQLYIRPDNYVAIVLVNDRVMYEGRAPGRWSMGSTRIILPYNIVYLLGSAVMAHGGLGVRLDRDTVRFTVEPRRFRLDIKIIK